MRKVAQAVIGALVLAGAAVVLIWQWHTIRDGFRAVGAWRLIGAAAVTLLRHGAVAFAWIWLVRLFGGRGRIAPFARAYGLALLPKYVPGRVAAQGVRWIASREAGLGSPAIAASLVWETIIALAAAGVVGAITLGAAAGGAGALAIGFALALTAGTAGLVLIARLRPTWLQGRWSAWTGAAAIAGRPLTLMPSLAAAAIGWLGAGAALSIVAAPFGSIGLLAATGWSALAWAVGYLSLIAPAGLVVREGVIAWGLTAAIGAGPAIAVAALSRAAGVLAELLLTAVALRLPSR